MKNGIKAIIFDFDGVIVDSFDNNYFVYKEICRLLNKNFPSSNVEEFREWYDSYWPHNFRRIGITEESESKKGEKIFRETLPKLEVSLYQKNFN